MKLLFNSVLALLSETKCRYRMLQVQDAEVLRGTGRAGVNAFLSKAYWSMILSSPPGKKKILNSLLQNSMPYCSHFSEVTVYNIALLSPLRNNIIYWSSSFIVDVISIFWDRDTFCMMYTLLTSNSSCLLYVQGFIIRNIYASWYPVVLCLLFSALHRKLNFFSFWLTPT